MNSHLTDKLHRLLFVATTLLALLSPSRAKADTSEYAFDIISEYVDDITSYHKQFPHVEFVYGNPSEKASGFLVTITPHPENAYLSWLGYANRRKDDTINPNDFRVWITAYDWHAAPFSLFHTDTQSLQYLDIRRKDTMPFALFISAEDIEERAPRGGNDYDKLGVIIFRLCPRFACSIDAEYPDGMASAGYSVGMEPRTTNFTYKPPKNFLQSKIEWVEEADRYMDEHPERKYFFKREEVWQCSGWFFHMNYINKNIIRNKINDNHYVIFTLWKDKEHTKPLIFSYMKDNLFAGGATADASRMEERFNYVAYPHKGFDDWSLFIPWECIDYWWKDGIKATKDNHTCTAYFTLTLSNDGKTPATNLSYDYSGWLSIEKEVPEEKPICDHSKWESKISKSGSSSVPLPGGCTQNYDIWSIYKHCLICGEDFDCSHTNLYKGVVDPNHNLEVIPLSEKEIDRKRVIQDGRITNYITEEVWYYCKNECCPYKEPRYNHWTVIEIEPCPPHDWKDISRKETDRVTIETGNFFVTTITCEVISQCQKCKLEKPRYEKEEKRVPKPPVRPPYPPEDSTTVDTTVNTCQHDWKEIRRKETNRKTVIIDEDCVKTIITYEVISQCQKCKLEEPGEETKEIPHCHEWTYYSTKEREKVSGTKQFEPYDKDSLTIDIDSTLCMVKDTLNCQDSLRMFKKTLDSQNSICYVSTEPVKRHTWLAFNKNNNYMGFTDDDAGVLNAVTYQVAEDLIEKINEEVRHLNVIFNLPSVEEMRQLIKEDKAKFDADPVQPLTYFYVDSIEVYDGKGQRVPDEKLITAPEGAKLRIMVGRMNKDGEVEMVDIFTADAETGFMLVATPFTPEPKSTTSVKFYRKYWRKCNTCEIEQLITENQFRNGRYHRALIGD